MTDMSVGFVDELIESPTGVALLAELEAMQRPDVLPREIQRAAQDLINLEVTLGRRKPPHRANR